MPRSQAPAPAGESDEEGFSMLPQYAIGDRVRLHRPAQGSPPGAVGIVVRVNRHAPAGAVISYFVRMKWGKELTLYPDELEAALPDQRRSPMSRERKLLF